MSFTPKAERQAQAHADSYIGVNIGLDVLKTLIEMSQPRNNAQLITLEMARNAAASAS